MSTGYPDGQKITQWIGAPIAQAVAAPIGAGQIVIGPTRLASWASVIVALKPAGGQVTITVSQTIPNGPAGLILSQQVIVPAGATVFESFVLFGAAVTITLQGAAGGTTVDYAVTPSNTTTNAQVLTNATINVQRNEVLVAAEPTLDFVDAGGQSWGVADDATNTRVKLTPPRANLGANGVLAVVNTAVTSLLFSRSIPANVLGANGMLKVRLVGSYRNASAGADSLRIQIDFGGILVWSDTWAVNMEAAVPTRPLVIDLLLANQGATNSQYAAGFVAIGDPNGAPASGIGKLNGPINDANTLGRVASFATAGTIAADTTVAQPFNIWVQHGTAAATIETRRYAVACEVV